jgi:hypothetical protein
MHYDCLFLVIYYSLLKEKLIVADLVKKSSQSCAEPGFSLPIVLCEAHIVTTLCSCTLFEAGEATQHIFQQYYNQLQVLLKIRCFHGHCCTISHHKHHKSCFCGREMNQITSGEGRWMVLP